jgi:ligand-binding sensor domain-containing protein
LSSPRPTANTRAGDGVPALLFIAAVLVVTALSPCAAEDAAGGNVVTTLGPRLRVVFQARDGAHWFGSTGAGAYRYDGKRIVRFTAADGLTGDGITGIEEDGAGNVCVGTGGGVSRFDGRAFHVLPVADASRSEWKLGRDDVWLRGPHDTGSVYRFDGKELFRLTLPKTKRGDAFEALYPRSKYPNITYSPYDVYTVFKDSRGHIWFGTANLGACRYDGNSFAWIAETEFGLGEYHSGGTRSIAEDKDKRIWISRTLYRFDVDVPSPGAPPDKGSVAPMRFRRERGLGKEEDPYSDFISAVKDDNGHLWFATLGAGVWRLDGARWTQYPILHAGRQIWIYSIYRDRQGVLWVGTNEHGVYRFDGKVFEPFKP